VALAASTARNLLKNNNRRLYFIKNVTIWMKGMPTVLNNRDRQVFEGSTAVNLSISLFLSNQVYSGSNFLLKIAIVDQGPSSLVCNFLITIDDPNLPPLIELKAMFMDLLVKSFASSKFTRPYLRLLGMSSPAFQHVTSISLSKPTPNLAVSPSSYLKRFELDGVVLEFFGINKLSYFEKFSMETAIEEFLLDALKSDFDIIRFDNIHLELSAGIFLVLTSSLRIKMSVLSLGTNKLNNDAMKMIRVDLLRDIKTSFKNKISVLTPNILPFRISLRSEVLRFVGFVRLQLRTGTLDSCGSKEPCQTPSSKIVLP